MRVLHHITIDSNCPVNGDADRYDCTVLVHDRVLPCEEVVAAVAAVTSQGPVFQEALTQELANLLRAPVRTVGTHVRGQVKTTVICHLTLHGQKEE